MKKLKTNRSIALFVILSIISILMNVSITLRIRKLGIKMLTGAYEMAALEFVLLAVQLGIGIYMFVLFWGLCRDLNIICENYDKMAGTKKSPNYLVVCLLSGITLGIYYLYWVYKQGNRLCEAGRNYYKRDIKENGAAYLLFAILGIFTCGIFRYIFMGKFLKNMNTLSEAYNENLINGEEKEQNHNLKNRGNDVDNPTIAMESGEGKMECCLGIYEGAIFPIQETELIIGRDESRANVVIKNGKVSRVHCGIYYKEADNTYVVTDYSSNGTFYKNGERFGQNVPTVCTPGTILVIAQSGNEFLLK